MTTLTKDGGVFETAKMRTRSALTWVLLALMAWAGTTELMMAQAAQKAIATMSLQSASPELKGGDAEQGSGQREEG